MTNERLVNHIVSLACHSCSRFPRMLGSLREELTTLRRMSMLQGANQLVNLGAVVCSALMVWKLMMVLLATESPIVVVLSESMSPGYNRGDLLFLAHTRPLEVGDVVVFKLDGRDIPIVHRVLRVHTGPGGEVFYLTKGDANLGDDRGLYNRGQEWISDRLIMGQSIGYLPSVGMATIYLTEKLWLRYLVIGSLAFFVLASHEH